MEKNLVKQIKKSFKNIGEDMKLLNSRLENTENKIKKMGNYMDDIIESNDKIKKQIKNLHDMIGEDTKEDLGIDDDLYGGMDKEEENDDVDELLKDAENSRR